MAYIKYISFAEGRLVVMATISIVDKDGVHTLIKTLSADNIDDLVKQYKELNIEDLPVPL